MLTRRSFLFGAGAGFIAAQMLDKFFNHLDVRGEPLVFAPKDPINTLIVSRDQNLRIRLRKMVRLTWRDVLGLDSYDPWCRAEVLAHWEIAEHQLDEEISPRGYSAWSSYDLFAERARWLLAKLDLGPSLKRPNTFGGIHFDRRFAYCDDLLSVSLLQARLNELGTGLKVEWI